MRTIRNALLVGAVATVATLGVPVLASTATTAWAQGPGCEATSLTVTNDTAGTLYAAFQPGSTPFESYDLTLTAAGATSAFARQQVAPGASLESGPTGPGQYNLSAVPLEQGGQPNLSLIYSGDLTLTCESTSTLSLVEFLGRGAPTAEDGGVTGSEQQAGAPDIRTPTRIETGAEGTAPGA